MTRIENIELDQRIQNYFSKKDWRKLMSNIEKTYNYLNEMFDNCQYFKDPEKQVSKDYRLKHSYRVANIARKIAEQEGLNIDAYVCGALLHDIGYIHSFEDSSDYKNHGRYGAKLAKDFIESLDLSNEDKQQILYGIASHVDGKADIEGSDTVLSETISDCDNIDRFDCYRLHENLIYADFTNKITSEQISYLETRIVKLNELKTMDFATKTATKLWIDNLDYQIDFCVKLLQQLNSSSVVF